MKVELVHPESVTEPRHWVRHDQAFAMMLRPGSIEWGSKRSALEKFSNQGRANSVAGNVAYHNAESFLPVWEHDSDTEWPQSERDSRYFAKLRRALARMHPEGRQLVMSIAQKVSSLNH